MLVLLCFHGWKTGVRFLEREDERLAREPPAPIQPHGVRRVLFSLIFFNALFAMRVKLCALSRRTHLRIHSAAQTLYFVNVRESLA